MCDIMLDNLQTDMRFRILAGRGGPDCGSSLLLFYGSTARHAKEIRNTQDDANYHFVSGCRNHGSTADAAGR
jgi:hypothetical protein